VTTAQPARRIPLRSVTSGGQAIDQDLHDGVYLEELDRQALIADAALTTAWQRGMTRTVDDAPTWSHLQAALFAGIVVARILNPGHSVKSYPGRNKQQAAAQARGRRLRHRLGVDLSSPLFDVTAVRDSLEHFDERLDAALAPNPTNISDWYITDGVALVTSDAATAAGVPSGIGLRVFSPLGGILRFQDAELDLFAWDQALLGLRQHIGTARAAILSSPGRHPFGGQDRIELRSPAEARHSCELWLAQREVAGAHIDVPARLYS